MKQLKFTLLFLVIALNPYALFSQTEAQKAVIDAEYNRILEHLNIPTNDISATSRDEDDLLLALRRDNYQIDVWVETDSSEYTYNSNNLLTEILTKRLDPVSLIWEETRRVSFEYDANNNQTYRLVEIKDDQDWENQSRYIYEYDANNNRTLWSFQDWEGGIWTYFLQLTYEYNDESLLTFFLVELGNGTTTWENDTRSTYTYNSDNLVESIFSERWDEAAWENNSQSFYEYNSDMMFSNILRKTWDFDELNWVDSSTSIYEYDSNGNRTAITDQIWDGFSWINDSKRTYEYDQNDNNTLFLAQRWDAGLASWRNINQNIYEYDSDNNETSYVAQSWIDDAWNNDFKSTKDYDEYNNIVYLLNQGWNVMDSLWENTTRTYYYYQIFTDVNDIATLGFNIEVSPNPGNGYFNLNFEDADFQNLKVEVYSTVGQLMHQQIIEGGTGNETLNLTALGAGVYYLHIMVEDRHTTKAIQIVR